MRKEQHSKKSDEEQRERSFFLHYVFVELAFTLGATAPLLLVVFYFFTAKSLPIVSTSQPSRMFAGLILVELVILVFVRIVGLIGHHNRDVILLKKRLGKIYSLALKQSALNPQLKSTTSNE